MIALRLYDKLICITFRLRVFWRRDCQQRCITLLGSKRFTVQLRENSRGFCTGTSLIHKSHNYWSTPCILIRVVALRFAALNVSNELSWPPLCFVLPGIPDLAFIKRTIGCFRILKLTWILFLLFKRNEQMATFRVTVHQARHNVRTNTAEHRTST